MARRQLRSVMPKRSGSPTGDQVAGVASLLMRFTRSRFAVIASLALIAPGCGKGDSSSGTTTGTTTGTTAGTTAAPFVSAPVSADDCVNEGDPIQLVPGALPPAIRPCQLPTTLVIQDLRPGTGRAAAVGDTVFVDYTGIRSADGLKFDSSYERDEPLDFPLGRGGVIKGWDDGLIGAQAGTVRRLDIPADLAYGDNPPGDDIKPGDALTFVLEVRAVIPPATPDQAPLDIEIPPSVGATDVTFTDVTVGDGALVESGNTALVHLLLVRGDNQAVLYNTWDRNELVPVPIGEQSPIPGLGKGLEGARVGTVRVISMPPTFAFGDAGDTQLGLPPGTDLIIVTEVFGVV